MDSARNINSAMILPRLHYRLILNPVANTGRWLMKWVLRWAGIVAAGLVVIIAVGLTLVYAVSSRAMSKEYRRHSVSIDPRGFGVDRQGPAPRHRGKSV